MRISTSRIYSLLRLNLVNFFFPPRLKISPHHIEFREQDSLLIFWDKNYEKVSMHRLSSINPNPGIIWDSLTIRTNGGEEIKIKGLRKRDSRRAHAAISNYSGR